MTDRPHEFPNFERRPYSAVDVVVVVVVVAGTEIAELLDDDVDDPRYGCELFRMNNYSYNLGEGCLIVGHTSTEIFIILKNISNNSSLELAYLIVYI